MLLGGSEDKDGIARGLLQGLEEGIKSRDREHVHLVYDIDLVASESGRHGDLLGELTDILDGVIRCGIELEDIEGSLLIEGTTALTRITGLPLRA